MLELNDDFWNFMITETWENKMISEIYRLLAENILMD